MKIAGTTYEVHLDLKEDDINDINLLIHRQKELVLSQKIIQFEDIIQTLDGFLKQKDIFLPKNRFNVILEQMEGLYFEYTSKQKELKDKHITRQKHSQAALHTLSSYPKQAPQKIILLGFSYAGKTSIYQVIFEGKLPHETQILRPTMGVERHNINIPTLLDKIEDKPARVTTQELSTGQNLVIWDLGGQESFLQRYREDPELYFGNSSCLIFIVDAFAVQQYEEARKYLHESIQLMADHGKQGRDGKYSRNVFCFLHKMDHFANRDEQFANLENYFRQDPGTGQPDYNIQFYPTSIFDSSIYSAWTSVMQTIMPKSSKLNILAHQLKEDLGLYASLIIEKRTGLPICASKTLLDDAVLVGSTNRILITIERALPEFELAGFSEFRVKTKSGILDVRLFNTYYLLVLLYPPTVDIYTPKNNAKVNEFINTMEITI